MNKMKQFHKKAELHCYCLQPGDGTIYNFGFLYPEKVVNCFSGYGSGENYLMVYIEMGSGHAWIWVWRGMSVNKETVKEVMVHTGDVDRYSVTAILLALEVLAVNPKDTEGAREAMLRVPEILS